MKQNEAAESDNGEKKPPAGGDQTPPKTPKKPKLMRPPVLSKNSDKNDKENFSNFQIKILEGMMERRIAEIMKS